MAVSNLVVRSGVGSWASIKYLITRGLDIYGPRNVVFLSKENKTIRLSK